MSRKETILKVMAAIQARLSESNPRKYAVVLVKNDDCWMFIWTREDRDGLLKQIERLADDSDVERFDRNDAARMTYLVRRIEDVNGPKPELLTTDEAEDDTFRPEHKNCSCSLPGEMECYEKSLVVAKHFKRDGDDVWEYLSTATDGEILSRKLKRREIDWNAETQQFKK